MQNVIPRPNMDQAFVQTVRRHAELQAKLEAMTDAGDTLSPEATDLRRRIETLTRWLDQRSRHLQIPWEYRPRIYRRKAEPLMDPEVALVRATQQAAIRKAYFLSKKKAS